MHARVPAQLCPGHTGVQSIDSHTRAWGEEGRGETGGGGRRQIHSPPGRLTRPTRSSRAAPSCAGSHPWIHITPLALKPPDHVGAPCKAAPLPDCPEQSPPNLRVCTKSPRGPELPTPLGPPTPPTESETVGRGRGLRCCDYDELPAALMRLAQACSPRSRAKGRPFTFSSVGAEVGSFFILCTAGYGAARCQ